MMINRIKRMLAHGLGIGVHLDQIIRARRDRYVLAYHRVISSEQAKHDGVHETMWISPQRLASMIRWMCSVGEIVDHSRILDMSIPNDRPWFALTFDDGWKDNYEQAFPVLQQYQLPAIIFLATDAINSGNLFWPEDICTKTQWVIKEAGSLTVMEALDEVWKKMSPGKSSWRLAPMASVGYWIECLKFLNEDERQQHINEYFSRLQLSKVPLKGYIMNWADARKMKNHGISFGSHTHHHAIIKGLPLKQIVYELRKSKELITDKLQTEVDSFCYPNARYNGKESTILSCCGYRYGFRIDNTSVKKCSDTYYIPRFLVSERDWINPAYFKLRLLEMVLYRSKPYNPYLEN